MNTIPRTRYLKCTHLDPGPQFSHLDMNHNRTDDSEPHHGWKPVLEPRAEEIPETKRDKNAMKAKPFFLNVIACLITRPELFKPHNRRGWHHHKPSYDHRLYKALHKRISENTTL